MKTKVIAILISEGSHFLSQYLHLRTKALPVQTELPLLDIAEEITEESTEQTKAKASEIATGCIPCSIGHLGTCSGLLNEAIRFAKKEGIGSPEVIDRVGMCLDELNALERVDLRPEMIESLPKWERDIAQDALSISRNTRHELEQLTSTDQLNQVAAHTQQVRREVAQRWFGEKLKTQNPEEKQQLNEKISEKIEAAVEEEKGEMLPKITDKQRTQAEKRKTKYATKHPSEKIEVVVEEEKESKELDYDPHFAIRLQSELKKEFEGRGDR